MATPDDVLKAVTELCEAMRGQMAAVCEKYDSLAGSIDKMKSDAIVGTSQGQSGDMTRRGSLRSDGDDDLGPTGARLTAADAVVGRSELASLSRQVSEMKKLQNRPMSDLNAYADAQARADAVLRVHGERAAPPMASESLIDYEIRMARKMQPFSPTWKNVNLSIIAADGIAFGNALEAIRADAVQAGLNPVHLKPFEHKEYTEESRAGHRVTKFLGTGTMFAQLSRPVRRVSYIGTRNLQQNA